MDLPTAAKLLTTTHTGLKGYLQRYRDRLSPPRYRFDAFSRRRRMLPAADIRTLQAITIRTTRRIA